MKNIVSVLTLSVLLSPPLLAAEDSAKEKGYGMGHSAMPGYGMMMSQEQMKSMEKHMETMQEMMLTIKNEQDPKKRQALMQEHRQMMQQGMQMMHGGMSMDKHAGGKMGAMKMEKRMEMIEHRMGMMKMMMGQMIDHNYVEDNKAPQQ